MRKWIPRILLIIAVVMIVLLGLFFFMGKGKQKQSVPAESDTIVKDNVKVLKKGKVEELNEFDAETSGLEWKAVEVSVDSSAGVGAHLIVKLYGCSGIDAAIGVYGEAEGNVKLSTNSALKNDFGELDLEIGPEIKGKLVVDIPVFASGLLEQPLFVAKLPFFWEGHCRQKKAFI